MTARLLAAAGRAAVPWKNGGGVTREIAAWPEDAGMDDFRWRVSLADVGADGPFSSFDGVDRTLTMAEGAGMDLTVGGEHHRVDTPFVPRSFPGDLPTGCRLLAGPVVNLNVMWRRGDGAVPAVTVVRGGAAVAVPAAPAVLIVVLDGTAEVAGLTLDRYDAALLTGEDAVLRATGRTAVVRLAARAPLAAPTDP
ncbi:HutD family protein [Streptomyces sp. NBC_01571]|uniref:HutD/Ves family protein n=1 Tax=Streptomyces sp. NBC_01571 TaxID=2975883 RepID=UPI002258305A|nr:HutD family protein [Streptomyces sp. NBC_01571]MCX4574361.1 HutD family protein [Streptomyces sp. NBC_01571]